MLTAVLAMAAGGLLGGLVVLAVSSARERAARDHLLRRLESAFARISGHQASSLFEGGIPAELALERIEDAIEQMASSSATALESFSILCMALDEVGVAVSVFTISGDRVYENRPARTLLRQRFADTGLESAMEALVSKAIWSGECLADQFQVRGADPPISIKVVPLDGDKRRLGVMAVLSEETRRRVVNPAEVCRRVVGELDEWATERAVSLLLYDPPPAYRAVPVATAPEVVEDVIRTLAREAIQLSDPGSRVEIGAARVRDEVWMWVADEVSRAPGVLPGEPAELSESEYSTGDSRESGEQDSETRRYLAELAGAQLDTAYLEGKGRRFTLRFALRTFE